MNSTALFQLALNLESPWYIKDVELQTDSHNKPGELHIYIDFEVGGKFKNAAGELCGVHDTSERVWQHLNFFEHKCFLHARLPRIIDSNGKVNQVVVGWAREGSGFTLLFEAYAMMLIEYEMPINSVARTLRIVPNRVWRVFKHWVEKAIANDSLEFVEHIGIDETSSKKGHQYVTVSADLDARRVIHVSEGRGADAVGSLATALSLKEGDPEKIADVAIDMSPAYISGVMEHLPNAAITFDKFHVIALLNKAIDELRKGERKHCEMLKGHKYTFLHRYSSLSEEDRSELDYLLTVYPRLGDAYRLREIFYQFWELRDPIEAESFLIYWCDMVFDTDIVSLKRFGNTILAHLSGIVNYASSMITSGLMEGINNKIQLAKRRARGYRNPRNFINMIYFIAGKLKFDYPHYPL